MRIMIGSIRNVILGIVDTKHPVAADDPSFKVLSENCFNFFDGKMISSWCCVSGAIYKSCCFVRL